MEDGLGNSTSNLYTGRAIPWTTTVSSDRNCPSQEGTRFDAIFRYAANARIVRVDRIITNKVHRLIAYLRFPHSVNRNPQHWTTQWYLIPQYNRVTEGS